jgi:hypothetical protein
MPPMAVVQPETFTLTDQEAATLQSVQLARQTKLVGPNPVLIASIAVPFIVAGFVFVIGRVWYGDAMSMAHFFMLMVVFVAGMAIQTVNYLLYLQTTKRRVREKTRQIFEPRTVRLTDEGLEQTLPDLHSVHTWKGIDRVEQVSGLIFAWAGNLLVLVVPARAFPTLQDAQAFADACGTRTGHATR